MAFTRIGQHQRLSPEAAGRPTCSYTFRREGGCICSFGGYSRNLGGRGAVAG